MHHVGETTAFNSLALATLSNNYERRTRFTAMRVNPGEPAPDGTITHSLSRLIKSLHGV